MQRLEELERE